MTEHILYHGVKCYTHNNHNNTRAWCRLNVYLLFYCSIPTRLFLFLFLLHSSLSLYSRVHTFTNLMDILHLNKFSSSYFEHFIKTSRSKEGLIFIHN